MGGGPPPAPGGATSPMPVRPRPLPVPPAPAPAIRPRPAPPPAPPAIRPRPLPAPPPAPIPQPIPNNFPGRGQRLPDDDPRFVPFSGQAQRLPDEPVPVRPPKRKGDDDKATAKKPKVARFQGQGRKLPEGPRLVPFSGQAQRLPGEDNLRANAMRRLIELGKRKTREPEMPRSMLRRQAPMQSAKRQKIYGPRTEVFDMSN